MKLKFIVILNLLLFLLLFKLLFCDFCDAGVHPKCCNPPLNNIPKGDFSCHICHDEMLLSPTKSFTSSSSSSTRSRRSMNFNEEDISRPVAQPIDEMSNIFVSNKQNLNNSLRQQSVQKAMKYLRDNKTTNKKALKRLDGSTLNANTIKENDELLAETLLASAKTPRIRKKLLNEDLCSE